MLQSYYQETIYILLLSSKKFMVLIWSTSERWKAQSTLELPSISEHATSAMGIQHLNHLAITPHCIFFNDVLCDLENQNNNLWASISLLTSQNNLVFTYRYTRCPRKFFWSHFQRNFLLLFNFEIFLSTTLP